MIPETEKFTLIAPLDCFPSDNKLDSLARRERIIIKSKLKQDALILTLKWLQKRGLKLSSFSRQKPLFRKPVRMTLKVYLKTGMRLDLHNLSVKHFIDQLVLMNIIADDSIKEIPECVQKFGGWMGGGSCAEFTLEVIDSL